jgi:hypothetical protein
MNLKQNRESEVIETEMSNMRHIFRSRVSLCTKKFHIHRQTFFQKHVFFLTLRTLRNAKKKRHRNF